MLSVGGIAFYQAEEAKRNVFQFDERRLSGAMVRLKRESRAEGVVLLATCDRIEVWSDGAKGDLWEPMCRALGLAPLAWKPYAYAYTDEGAVDYLFHLACGLHSPLFGEDTIISQIEGASRLSRQCGCATALLQHVMQCAVSLAKKVHGSMSLDVPEPDLAPAIERALLPVHEKKLLVIGSSATARMLASFFQGRGWLVVMTLRDQRKIELVPPHVQAIGYEDRYRHLPDFPVVLCATKGLGYALEKNAPLGKDQQVFDLAKPKDVSPDLKGSCHLVEEDELVYERKNRQKVLAQSAPLIEAKKREFYAWKKRDENHEEVSSLSERAAQDLCYRLHGPLEALPLDPEAKKRFQAQLADLAFKSFAHVLYQKSPKRMVDLTHPLASGKALYAGDPPVQLAPWLTTKRDGCNLTKLVLGSHAGTHIDAPRHLFPDGKSLDQYPVSRFVGQAVVLPMGGPIEIPRGVTIALFATGWDAKWNDKEAYCQGYPTLDKAQRETLVRQGILMVGFDCPSPDPGTSLENHAFLLQNDVLILENLTALVPLVGMQVELHAAPLLFAHSDGAPVRVFCHF